MKSNIGISLIYESMYSVREFYGAKYKPVARKVVPILQYKEIQIGKMPDLPVVPQELERMKFTARLSKEQISSIISQVPAGFLSKLEIELLVHIMLQFDKAIVFMDLECGTFSQKYYVI